jgi:threonine dehydratase
MPGAGGRAGHHRRAARHSTEKERGDARPGRAPPRAWRGFRRGTLEALRIAEAEGLEFAPSFAPDLVKGVATYALELFRGAPALDALYVPVGLGSGICGCITARDLLGLRTEIIGVQSTGADAYARSFAAGRVVTTERADTRADGMATRIPTRCAGDHPPRRRAHRDRDG